MREKTGKAASYRVDVAEVVSGLLRKLPGVREGVMTGRPAFFAGTKLFAFLYRSGVVLKLPEETVRRLEGRPGVLPFQHGGKARMREWVEIRREDAAGYERDADLFREAHAFVSAGGAAHAKAAAGKGAKAAAGKGAKAAAGKGMKAAAGKGMKAAAGKGMKAAAGKGAKAAAGRRRGPPPSTGS